MNIASVTSPFENAEEMPWVIWKAQERVSVLQEQTQTDDGFTSVTHVVDQPELPPIIPAPPINRMQYNTVINRIEQASKRTGHFSTWKP